ncbi:MAG TPA: bestrophin family ion channel [Chitinophagales bacterium]|nr:bestrophin family ion channel [Chitinophagales bacterium]
MITYNPKDWFTFLFRFHKSDTFRELLPMIISLCIYSAGIAWFYTEYLHMYKNDHLKNLSMMHTMLSFVISMLLVFRTNSAYDRWWEGRKLWGSLINNSRNLALKLNAILPATANNERSFFAIMIPNYAVALKNHLRNSFHPNELQGHDLFNAEGIQPGHHQANYIARAMYNRIHELNRSGVINNEQLIYLNPELMSFTDICGACERIKNTPIPFSYSIFLKKFIFFFVMTLPFTMVFSLGYYCIPVVAFIFYALTSMELIAEEIEEPFGHDENDLPTETISKNIRKSVVEIFEGQ